MYTFNQTSLILQVDIMLLSLVIVAVEITSFTVACFFSRDSIVFLLQHKIITRQTKKKKHKTKTLDIEGGQNQSVPPPLLLIVHEVGVANLLAPFPLDFAISHQTTEAGEQGCFCKNAEIRCLHNLCGPSHVGLPQVKSGKYCF